MTILNKLLLFLILCTLSFAIVNADTGKKKIYPNGRIASDKSNEFIGKAKKKLQIKYNLATCMVGGGVRDKIWLIDLGFNKYGSPLTESEARKLLITITQDLLDMVNKDEKLRPYLENYPFTEKNVSVALFSYTKDMHHYYHPYLSSASASEGIVNFTSLDPGPRPEKVHLDKDEAYEESLTTLAKENQSKKE